MNRQPFLIGFLAALLIACSGYRGKAAEKRTWSDRSGKYSIEASFVRIEGNQVTLLKGDGKEVTLPIEKLSTRDRAYVRKQAMTGRSEDKKSDPRQTETSPKTEASDKKEIQGVARKFFEALRKQPASGMEDMLTAQASARYPSENSPVKELPAPDRGPSIRVGKVTIDGDTATVEVKVRLRGQFRDTVLHVRREAEKWLIHAISAPAADGTEQTIDFESAADDTPSRPTEDAGNSLEVPNGGAEEILQFIEKLVMTRPANVQSEADLREYLRKRHEVILKATDTILGGDATEDQMAKAIQFKLESLSLAAQLGMPDAAKQQEDFIKAIQKDSRPAIQAAIKPLEGVLRRLTLIGNEMEIEGLLLNGEPFDWASYEGKVVLVDFWATWCGPCLQEMPNVKKAYQQYHDKGFEVVGISLDQEIELVEKYVQTEEIPWAILFSPDKEANGWNHPMAVHYGIHGIPSTMLVGKDGKVISLSARGPQLEKQLQMLLGDQLPLDDESPKKQGRNEPRTRQGR
ncbi:MAG: redoxin family protein [Pirellulales bacterium]|nr:redoxin family protein [Pirellulales bacterium]